MLRPFPFLLLGSLLVQASCVQAASADCRIRLHRDVQLATRAVKLGDIATIEGSDDARLHALHALRVASLSQPGQPLRLSAQRLRHLIDVALPAYRDACTLEGAAAAIVTWSAKPFDIDAMLAWTMGALSSELRQREPQAQVSVEPLARPAAPRALPAGAVSYALRPGSLALAARMPVQVDVLVDGTHAATLPIWFRVSGTVPAWRLRTSAAAGAALRADMLRMERIAIPAEPVFATTPETLPDFRLKTNKEAGALLYANDAAPRKAIERGEQVAVRFVRGAVAVEDRAVALADGVAGSEVRLLNPRTHETYAATAVSAGMAEVK